jgi:hypothetical protein
VTLCSSLVSSSELRSFFFLQVYNVDKRIQEDNLQHLALFSEYGRMALGENVDEPSTKEPAAIPTASSTAVSAAPEESHEPKETVVKIVEEVTFIVMRSFSDAL